MLPHATDLIDLDAFTADSNPGNSDEPGKPLEAPGLAEGKAEDVVVEDQEIEEDVEGKWIQEIEEVLKIDGEEWIDVASDPPVAISKREPVHADGESGPAGATDSLDSFKKYTVTVAEEGGNPSSLPKEGGNPPPLPKEGGDPLSKFLPNMSKLKEKMRKRQVEGDATTPKRAPQIKYKADKAYEKQYEVHTAHHELDDNKPEQILDLCLIMDCTGSMASWIEHCKETLLTVIDSTVARDPTCKVRTAFVGYRDFGDGMGLFDLHDFSYDADKVKEFISNCTAKGGGDFPEDVQGAIRKALDLNWMGLDDSVKLAVLVADAPAHGRQYYFGHKHDDFPDGNPAGLILEDMMKEMSDKEILISLYQINNENNIMYDIMKKAHAEGAEKEGVEIVDMRDIQPAAVKRGPVGRRGSRRRKKKGSPATLDVADLSTMRRTYSVRTSYTIEAQCSKMRSNLRSSARRSCKSGW